MGKNHKNIHNNSGYNRIIATAMLCLLCFILLSSTPALAAWTINGTWDYTAELPESFISIYDHDLYLKASEKGVLVMNTTFAEGKEYFNTYTISGAGIAGYKVAGTPSWTEESYEFGPFPMTMSGDQYIPEKSWTIQPDGPVDVWGYDFTEKIVLRQDGENTISGMIILVHKDKYDSERVVTISGAVKGTRRVQDNSSGGCNTGAAGFGLLVIFGALIAVKRRFKM